jgi:peroxiredoxin Q/BCP
VLGINFSSSDELRAWSNETGLTSDLLFDADRSVAMAYGAAESADQEKPIRVSVLIGPDGKVLKTYTVTDAEGHPDEVLADLG